MNTFVLSGLLLLALLMLAIFWHRSKGQKRLPYDLQETLFSPAERSFLGVLELAVGDKARVFAKVRVADVLTPEAGLSKSKWQQYFNKISAKHVDYLLCHPTDLSFICAIELDDSSHRHQKRKARDLFLKTAFDSAGLPLLQIPASSHYQVEALREKIMPLLVTTSQPELGELMSGDRREPTFNVRLLGEVDVDSPPSSSAAASAAAKRDDAADSDVPTIPMIPASMMGSFAGSFDEDEDEEEAPTEQEARLCPRCEAPLVEREAKKGPYAGRLFLACSRFPQCRYATSHEES